MERLKAGGESKIKGYRQKLIFYVKCGDSAEQIGAIRLLRIAVIATRMNAGLVAMVHLDLARIPLRLFWQGI